MRFALLGDDARVWPLLTAIVRAPAHALVLAAAAPRFEAELAKLLPGLTIAAGWSDLLADARVEAVIVTGHDAEVLEGARQIVANGTPVLVLLAAGQGAAFVYELSLAVQDAGAVVVPILPLRYTGASEFVQRLQREGLLGQIQYLQLERRVVGRAAPPQPLLELAEVEDTLLEDLDAIRLWCGEVDQIAASRVGQMGDKASLVLVNLTLARGRQMVWSVTAASGAPAWQLTITGDRGAVVVRRDPALGRWSIEPRAAQDDDTSFEAACRELFHNEGGPAAAHDDSHEDQPERDWGPLVLQQFVARVEGTSTGPDWRDATRLWDVLDAFERSLRRRRTIDLHYEVLSERGQFKTHMTAAGCGVLLWTLLAMVVYLVGVQAIPLPGMVKQLARVAVFLPLGIFLILQLLIFVTRPAPPPNREPTSDKQ